jgi:ligand-binding sensor domain-containing protein
MFNKKITTSFLAILTLISFSTITYCDVWMRHINSNHADQLLGNDKEIWVRPNGGGLTRWDITSMKYERFYDANNGLPSSDIMNMVYDDEGRLIILESYSNILRFENGKFESLTEVPNAPDTICFANGKLYAGFPYDSYKGLSYFNGTDWIAIPEFSTYEVYGIAGDHQGGLWVSESLREGDIYTPSLIYYKDGLLTFYSAKEVTGSTDTGFNSLIANKMIVDSDGIVWASLSAGIAWFDGVKWQHYSWMDEIKEGIPPYPKNVVRDNEEIVWMADGNGGLRQFDGENWSKVSEYEDSKVLSVENNPDGGIWVGTEISLELFKGTERTPYLIENLLPISNYISAVDIDPDGRLWFGDGHGDLAMLDQKNWRVFHGTQITGLTMYKPGGLKDLLMSNFSGIWASFFYDVLNYKGNTWVSYADDLQEMPEFGTIKEAPDGSVWIASSPFHNGIAHRGGSNWEILFAPSSGVDDMTFDSKGKLWLASGNSGKILTWDGKDWTLVLDQKDFPDTVFQPTALTVLKDDTIWIGTTIGVLVLQDGVLIDSFDVNDGLPFKIDPRTGDKYIGVVRAIKQAPDDSIWVLTDYGLSIYDGSRFRAYTDFFTADVVVSDLAIRSDGRIFSVSDTGILEFIPTSVTLKMSLFADQIAYKAGDKLNISLMVNNYGPDETGDLYFVMLAPDGNLYSGLDWSRGLHPAASNITIPANYSLPVTKLLNLTLPSTTPPISQPGKYYFAIALSDTGTTYLRSKAIITIDVK